MKYKGCLKHNFTMQSCLDDTRHSGKQISITWLDLANAFGSVPHEYIETMLTLQGLPDKLVRVCIKTYQGACTRVTKANGFTDPILLDTVVKQGDLLSPMIFNLAIESIVRAAHNRAE